MTNKTKLTALTLAAAALTMTTLLADGAASAANQANQGGFERAARPGHSSGPAISQSENGNRNTEVAAAQVHTKYRYCRYGCGYGPWWRY